MQQIKLFLIAHKAISAGIAALAILAGYWGFSSLSADETEIRYALASVERGTLIASVSGSGQVSALNQIDLKAKASGDVVYIEAVNGQEVKTGVLLVQLDSRDAQRSVRDAEVTLKSAQLELEKMRGISTEEGTLRGLKEKAKDDLIKAYDDGFNTVANAFLELPQMVAGLYDTLFTTHSALGGSATLNIDYYADVADDYDMRAVQYKEDAYAKYQTARNAYDQNFSDYKSASRFSDPAVIESLISETYTTTKNISEAIKSANNLIQFYKDKLVEHNLKASSVADTHLATLSSYTNKTNTHLLNLLSIKNSIQTDKESIVGSVFDIADQEIRVAQAENDLLEAKEKLADYYVRAPFSGIISKMNATRYEPVSSGSVVATLITNQKMAEISLNEVDVAKVRLGQKATLTFDAIEGLNIAGEVAEIDTVGTVSQGVVTYNVKIGFITQDERVKSGMSVSASIITDVKQDALLVPNSAVKSKDDGYYVEVSDASISLDNQGVASSVSPRQQVVEVGLSNDTSTEILSGVKEGDQVVTRTINVSSVQTTQSAPSLFSGPGVRVSR